MALSYHPADNLDLSAYIKEGDLVSWGQGTAEPRKLVALYTGQRQKFGHTRAFVGLAVTDGLREEHMDVIRPVSYGALGHMGRLHKGGFLDLVPCRYSDMPNLIASGRLRPDVLFVQVSQAGPDGSHSLGFCNDFLLVAMKHARVVIAEVNAQVPWTYMDQPFDESLVTLAIESDAPLPDYVPPQPGDVDRAIAAHLAARIEDGATLQYGVGNIPAAVLESLRGHKNLGLHSGLITDESVDLVECGAITNARKAHMPGISVGAVSVGSEKLGRFLDQNREFCMVQASVSHGGATLAQLDNLVAINSALEVDLFGQVNAEQVGSRYVGAIGGQPDFMQAASSAANGFSAIAMPSTAGRTPRSKIVAKCNGPFVTTGRYDVDLVVTEQGVADLRGLTLADRCKAIIAVAAPEFRDDLIVAAREQGIL